MNNDKPNKPSDLSGGKDASSADSRFDVLDQVDFDDLNSAVDLSDDDALLEELLGESVRHTAPPAKRAEAPKPGAAPIASGVQGSAPATPTAHAANAAYAASATHVASAAPATSAPHTANAAHMVSGAAKREPAKTGPAKTAEKPHAVAGTARKREENTAYREIDARNSAQRIKDLMDSGKLTVALDNVFSLKSDMREAVKNELTVTIPLGSRDADLRPIAGGALIQSYLDLGKLDRADIEGKLYAIIESSEPEYDNEGETVEQTPDDVLFKVTACMVFAAELVERSGAHPEEKNVMYSAQDSILDQFLAENLCKVQKTRKKRLSRFSEAIEASGGEAAAKYAIYYNGAKKSTGSVFMRFLGDSTVFRITAALIAALCLVSIGFYSFSTSPIMSFIAKDTHLCMYVIMVEVFFIIGMSLLCVIVGFGGKIRAMKKKQKNNSVE